MTYRSLTAYCYDPNYGQLQIPLNQLEFLIPGHTAFYFYVIAVMYNTQLKLKNVSDVTINKDFLSVCSPPEAFLAVLLKIDASVISSTIKRIHVH